MVLFSLPSVSLVFRRKSVFDCKGSGTDKTWAWAASASISIFTSLAGDVSCPSSRNLVWTDHCKMNKAKAHVHTNDQSHNLERRHFVVWGYLFWKEDAGGDALRCPKIFEPNLDLLSFRIKCCILHHHDVGRNSSFRFLLPRIQCEQGHPCPRIFFTCVGVFQNQADFYPRSRI